MVDRILLWGALVLLIVGASAYSVSALQGSGYKVQDADYGVEYMQGGEDNTSYRLQPANYSVQGSNYKVQ